MTYKKVREEKLFFVKDEMGIVLEYKTCPFVNDIVCCHLDSCDSPCKKVLEKVDIIGGGTQWE